MFRVLKTSVFLRALVITVNFNPLFLVCRQSEFLNLTSQDLDVLDHGLKSRSDYK